MSLQAAFEILLYRYSGQRDFCLGVPFANRQDTQTEDMVGLFVNTLPMRAQLEGSPTFSELLVRIRNHALDAFAHGDLPLEHLVKALGIARNLARTPLFQVSLVFHQQPPMVDGSPDIENAWEMVRLKHRPTTAKYDLSAHFEPLGKGLRANFIYDLDRFSDSTIRQLAEHFLGILKQVGEHPQTRITSLDLMSTTERTALAAWNNTTWAKSDSGHLGKLLYRRVQTTPDALALTQGHHWWTYAQLGREVSSFARGLQLRGLKPGDRAALLTHRTPQAVAVALACFHLGATLVPLSWEWPKLRLEEVIEDATPTLVIYDAEIPEDWETSFFQGSLPLEDKSLFIPLEALRIGPVKKAMEIPPELPGNTPAYLLYTSGSTGKPKGVLGTHEALANRLQSLWHSHPHGANEVGLLKKASIFIGFFTELLGPLGYGRPLVLAEPAEERSPEAILDLILRHRITRLWAFPSLLTGMASITSERRHQLRCLKYIFSSGEILPLGLSQTLAEDLPGTTQINIYGSTELASDVSLHEIPRQGMTMPAIGSPMANNQLWTLTESGALQPPHLPGELAVGGAHLAQAYWHQPIMTALQFRPDPFSGKKGARLFHTGDWVSMDPKQGMSLHRRMDQIFKVRGYRIHPRGIETILHEHSQIHDCAVVTTPGAGEMSELTAYLVAQANLKPGQIREFLGRKLPTYAVPTRYLFVKVLPRTLNGKLLIAELPRPKSASTRASAVFAPPRNQKETLIATIWTDVLGKARVGIHDNFFDLGGHSLLAAQVRARMGQALGWDLPLSSLFAHQTIAALVSHLDQLQAAPQPFVPISASGKKPIPSFAQERWWFLQQLEGGNHYQLLRGYRMNGVNALVIEEALHTVIARHQPLRTVFLERHGQPQIHLDSKKKHRLNHIDLSRIAATDDPVQDIMDRERNRSFQLHLEPGFRAIWLDMGSNEAVLILHFHHIAIDAWGMDRFREELARCYRALLSKKAPELSQLPASYADFSHWQRQRLQGEGARVLKYFWRQKLKDTPALQLPYDSPRSMWSTHSGSQVSLSFSREFTDRLTRFAQTENATVYMVLLAAYRALLQRLSDQTDFCIGTPVAHRNHPSWEPLIGACVNTLALRIRSGKNPTFEELLRCTRQETLAALDHQDLPFSQVVDTVNPPRDSSRHPLFQVMFVFFNTPQTQRGAENRTRNQLFGNPITSTSETTLFDLTLYLGVQRGKLTGRMTFSSDLFHSATVAEFCQQYRRVLRQIIANPHKKLAQLALFPNHRIRDIRRLWGGTSLQPRGPFLSDRIAAQLAVERDRIALVDDRTHFSKAFLDRQVQALATRLRHLGTGPEVPVAMCMRRSAMRGHRSTRGSAGRRGIATHSPGSTHCPLMQTTSTSQSQGSSLRCKPTTEIARCFVPPRAPRSRIYQ